MQFVERVKRKALHFADQVPLPKRARLGVAWVSALLGRPPRRDLAGHSLHDLLGACNSAAGIDRCVATFSWNELHRYAAAYLPGVVDLGFWKFQRAQLIADDAKASLRAYECASDALGSDPGEWDQAINHFDGAVPVPVAVPLPPAQSVLVQQMHSEEDAQMPDSGDPASASDPASGNAGATMTAAAASAAGSVRDCANMAARPNVGAREDICTLPYTYGGSLVHREKAALIEAGGRGGGDCSHWRPVKGDGNCYYRAIGFPLFERAFGEPPLRYDGDAAKLLERLASVVDRVGADGSRERAEHVWLLTQMEQAMESGCSWEEAHGWTLRDAFCYDGRTDRAVIRALRHLAAAWLEAHAHEASSPGGLTWEGAIETDGAAGSSMPEFCQKVVLAMETEAEAPVPQTMPAALRHWPVRAFYLDGDRKNHLFEDFPACYPPPPPGSAEAAPKLFYLLKPGHYDMLYARRTYGGDAMGGGGGSMGGGGGGLRRQTTSPLQRPVLPMGPEEGSACETFGFPQGERADGVPAGSVVATLNAGVERATAAMDRGGGGNAAEDGVFRLLDPHGGPHCIAPTRLLPDGRNFSRVELDECDAFAARVAPLAHADAKRLGQDFVEGKLRHGSRLEQRLYGEMMQQAAKWAAEAQPRREPGDVLWELLADRLLQKRPLAFFGADDQFLLRDGVSVGAGGFELIGTDREGAPPERALGSYNPRTGDFPPVLAFPGAGLESLLSYDEMPLAALLGVATPTFFMNNGDRHNGGVPGERGTYEPSGVYTGLVGARFERLGRMEAAHMLVDAEHHTAQNGYGAGGRRANEAAHELLRPWARLYGEAGETFPSFEEVHGAARGGGGGGGAAPPHAAGKFLRVTLAGAAPGSYCYLNREAYRRRMRLVVEPLLLDANERGHAANSKAYVHMVGLGIGVWAVSEAEQGEDIVSVFAEVMRAHYLPWVGDVDFSWFPGNCARSGCGGVPDRGSFHAAIEGGSEVNSIEIHFSQRNPADRLFKERLLVCVFAWDGNSFPGNEYWTGVATGQPKLFRASGDPAAAACSMITTLALPQANPRVCGRCTKLLPRSAGRSQRGPESAAHVHYKAQMPAAEGGAREVTLRFMRANSTFATVEVGGAPRGHGRWEQQVGGMLKLTWHTPRHELARLNLLRMDDGGDTLDAGAGVLFERFDHTGQASAAATAAAAMAAAASAGAGGGAQMVAPAAAQSSEPPGPGFYQVEVAGQPGMFLNCTKHADMLTVDTQPTPIQLRPGSGAGNYERLVVLGASGGESLLVYDTAPRNRYVFHRRPRRMYQEDFESLSKWKVMDLGFGDGTFAIGNVGDLADDAGVCLLHFDVQGQTFDVRPMGDDDPTHLCRFRFRPLGS